MRRLLRTTLVGALVTLMGISPSSAGWLLGRVRCQPAPVCPPAPCLPVCQPACPPQPCVPVCPPACCEPGISGQIIVDGALPPVESLPLGDGISEPPAPAWTEPAAPEPPANIQPEIDEPAADEAVPAPPRRDAEPQPAEPESQPIEPEPQPIEPEPQPAEAEPQPAEAEPQPAEPESEPVDPLPAEPSEPSAADPVEDIFGAPPFDAPPADQPPANEPAPADDVFGAPPFDAPPADQPPANEPAPADDIFGAPPADQPPANEPAPVDDLFGAPPADQPPANEPAPVDDIFGAPPADQPPANEPPPAEDIFGAPPAAGTDSANDIFGAPPGAEPPAEGEGEETAEDIFGAPESSAAPAEDAADPIGDLFAPPAEDAADSAGVFSEGPIAADPIAEAEVLTDLFRESEAEAAEPVGERREELFDEPQQPAPADAAPDAAPTSDDVLNFDSLFGAAAPQADATPAMTVAAPVPAVVDPLSQTRMRTWIDNTGDFSTRGRLIEVGDGYVRLLKQNGRTCTVPEQRLSRADKVYVEGIIARLPAASVAMLVSE